MFFDSLPPNFLRIMEYDLESKPMLCTGAFDRGTLETGPELFIFFSD